MSKLKVYGWTDFKGRTQMRCIVAAPSFAAANRAALAAGLFKIRKDYCSETSNEGDLTAALAQPGVILWQPLDDCRADYEALNGSIMGVMENTNPHAHYMGLSDASELELFQALMTAIKRLEEAGGKTDDLREVANRVADPYRGMSQSETSSAITDEMVERLAVHLLNQYRAMADVSPIESLDSFSEFARRDWQRQARVLLVAAFGGNVAAAPQRASRCLPL